MPFYLIRFSAAPETWARLIVKPEDRREAVRAATEALGGKLHGYWYAFGPADGYVLIEAPDNTTVAAEIVSVASSGAFTSLETTVLLTVEEMLEALGKAKALPYRPPGGG